MPYFTLIYHLVVFYFNTIAWNIYCSSEIKKSLRYRFNYRSTAYMVKHGFYDFLNWFDDRAWYPLGRIIGGTIYPGLMITSATIYHFLQALNLTIDVRNVCVFLAPLFSSFTTIVTYLLTSELHSKV